MKFSIGKNKAFLRTVQILRGNLGLFDKNMPPQAHKTSSETAKHQNTRQSHALRLRTNTTAPTFSKTGYGTCRFSLQNPVAENGLKNHARKRRLRLSLL